MYKPTFCKASAKRPLVAVFPNSRIAFNTDKNHFENSGQNTLANTSFYVIRFYLFSCLSVLVLVNKKANWNGFVLSKI